MKTLSFKNTNFELGLKFGSYIAIPNNDFKLHFNQISITPNYFFTSDYLLIVGTIKKEFKTLKELKTFCKHLEFTA